MNNNHVCDHLCDVKEATKTVRVAQARLEALGAFCASAEQTPAVGSAFAYGPVMSRSASLCVSPACSAKSMSVRPYDASRRAREMTH